MHYSLLVRCIAEFIGTEAIMVALGNGSVANVELKGTKGYHGGWVLIGFGYGIGVMIPALMFATVSGTQINPAMTLAMAVTVISLGRSSALHRGASSGHHWSTHFGIGLQALLRKTTDAEAYPVFSTIDAADSKLNGFINEFIGKSFTVLGAISMTADKLYRRWILSA
ncbi:aquaporin [Limosilactobacillus fermentum]